MSSRTKRTACLKSTGVELHVYNRGVNQGTIFFKQEDYQAFIQLVHDALPGSGITILQFVLMPNHFHLVVKQAHPYDISAFMKRITEKHAKRINGLRRRSGHLFQSRYKISRVPGPDALLHLSHYVPSNPVAAKLVKRPSDWPFSSMRDYLGSAVTGLVDVDPLLDLIGGRERYLQFLKEYDSRGPDTVWKYLLKTA